MILSYFYVSISKCKQISAMDRVNCLVENVRFPLLSYLLSYLLTSI